MNPIFNIFVLLLSVFLSSCTMYANQSHRMAADVYFNQPMIFSTDMMLIETRKGNPLEDGNYWIFAVPIKMYNNNYINAPIPSLADYQQNPRRWQQWTATTGLFTDTSRILGILPRGTKFHIIDIAANPNAHSYWVTVMIDVGPYRGKTALYGNPRSIIPNLYE